MSRHNREPQAVLLALEAHATSARSGFACLFSTSDEYEAALITQRRAQGRYGSRLSRWPMVAFVAGSLMMATAAWFIG